LDGHEHSMCGGTDFRKPTIHNFTSAR
jgi:hypothetical protein